MSDVKFIREPIYDMVPKGKFAQLESDLAAANATIEALQADLAGTAELLLREQALAESRSLALATMREALTEISGGAIETLDFTDRLYTTGRVADGVQIEFETHGPARRIREIKALIAQPDDAAAALAGAVMSAADRMYERAHQEWEVDHTEFCECDRSRIEADRCECPEPQDVQAYRRARSALRGHGAAEG
jgi:hypothetical protein